MVGVEQGAFRTQAEEEEIKSERWQEKEFAIAGCFCGCSGRGFGRKCITRVDLAAQLPDSNDSLPSRARSLISRHTSQSIESLSSNIHFSFLSLTSPLSFVTSYRTTTANQTLQRHCLVHQDSSLASSAVLPGVTMADLLLREFSRIRADSQTTQAIVLQENYEYDDTAHFSHVSYFLP